mgnify:CR=1 FL=1
MIKLIFILVFLSTLASAQQEKPESNSDLRYGKTVFVYNDLKKNLKYTFKKKTTGESYLFSSDSGLVKLSSSQETDFEPLVVNLFIKIKYQLDEFNQECKQVSHLEYLGDKTSVCEKDTSRLKLVAEIKKRFDSIIINTKR